MLATTITPSEGLTTGRRIVTIRGAGFRLPVPEVGGSSWRRTVAVWFGGQLADEVVPLAHYRLAVVVPAFRGDPGDLPAVVDVRVANLDDAGLPVPGEDVTLADAFTYRRPSLTVEGDLVAVVRAVVLQLRRDLIANVTTSADPDYAAETATGLTAIAELPVVVLDGPRIAPAAGVYRDNDVDTMGPDGEGVLTSVASPFTVALTWDIIATCDRKIEALNLVNNIVRTFDRRPWFRIPERSPDGSIVEAEVDAKIVGEFRPSDRWGDRVHSFEATLRVEPVRLGDGYGLALGGSPVDGVAAGVAPPGGLVLELEQEGIEP